MLSSAHPKAEMMEVSMHASVHESLLTVTQVRTSDSLVGVFRSHSNPAV